VFAQLITKGEGPRLHSFVVPSSDTRQRPARRHHLGLAHYKGACPGGQRRIQFDHVRVPRENLLNRYADVAPDGTYSSPIENEGRRFFTMLGTLIRGRVTVGGSAAAAARVALDIATRYALQRRQFDAPGQDDEVLIMDYLCTSAGCIPLIAKSYCAAVRAERAGGHVPRHCRPPRIPTPRNSASWSPARPG
jgi:acyl-CoA oxidase